MRLIDADALIEHLRKDPLFCMVERYGIEGVIENAPTIEPSEQYKKGFEDAKRSFLIELARESLSADEYVPHKACFDCMNRATRLCKGTLNEQEWCPIVQKCDNAITAEPSGDLVNRQLLIGAIEKCGEKKIYPQALIETIKALPSAEPSSDDLISRQNAIDAVCQLDWYYFSKNGKFEGGAWYDSYYKHDDVIEAIEEVPSVVEIPESPKGVYQCFHCGSYSVVWGADFDFSDYGYEGEGIIHSCHCTNCGAEIEYMIPITDDDIEELTEIYDD